MQNKVNLGGEMETEDNIKIEESAAKKPINIVLNGIFAILAILVSMLIFYLTYSTYSDSIIGILIYNFFGTIFAVISGILISKIITSKIVNWKSFPKLTRFLTSLIIIFIVLAACYYVPRFVADSVARFQNSTQIRQYNSTQIFTVDSSTANPASFVSAVNVTPVVLWEYLGGKQNLLYLNNSKLVDSGINVPTSNTVFAPDNSTFATGNVVYGDDSNEQKTIFSVYKNNSKTTLTFSGKTYINDNSTFSPDSKYLFVELHNNNQTHRIAQSNVCAINLQDFQGKVYSLAQFKKWFAQNWPAQTININNTPDDFDGNQIRQNVPKAISYTDMDQLADIYQMLGIDSIINSAVKISDYEYFITGSVEDRHEETGGALIYYNSKTAELKTISNKPIYASPVLFSKY